jgi:hypothetical protein
MAKVNQPIPGALSFDTQLSRDTSSQGIINSQILQGGYQEVSTIQDRNDITIFETSAVYDGFTQSGDANNGIATGSRQIGMLVFVIEEQKFYQLMPEGFFGNGGTDGFTIWNDLNQAEKAVRMKPDETVLLSAGDPFLGTSNEYVDCASLQISCEADSVWVEVSIAGTSGTSGTSGETGSQGSAGSSGTSGTSGTSGEAGSQGSAGSSGTSGTSGEAGSQGSAGSSGTSGTSGEKGFSGTSGTSGEAGSQGSAGSSGTSGTSGENVFKFSQTDADPFYRVGGDSEYENAVNNQNPDLYVSKGLTYTFIRSDEGYPLTIFSQNGNLAAGIVSGSLPIQQGSDLVWKVPQDAYGTYTYLSTTSDKLQGNIIVCCADGNSAPTPTPTPTPTTTLTDPDTPDYTYWKAENCKNSTDVIDIRTTDEKVGLTKFSVIVAIPGETACYEIQGGGSPNQTDITAAYTDCEECERGLS